MGKIYTSYYAKKNWPPRAARGKTRLDMRGAIAISRDLCMHASYMPGDGRRTNSAQANKNDCPKLSASNESASAPSSFVCAILKPSPRVRALRPYWCTYYHCLSFSTRRSSYQPVWRLHVQPSTTVIRFPQSFSSAPPREHETGDNAPAFPSTRHTYREARESKTNSSTAVAATYGTYEQQ